MKKLSKSKLENIWNFLQNKHKWIVAIIMIWFVVVSVFNAWSDSATFDEIAHIPAGYSYLTEHEMRLNPEHPPLIKDLSAIPLLFMNLNFDTSKSFWTGDLPKKWDEGQWAAGRHLIWEAGNNPEQVIFWSRIPIILVSVALGLFIFKWTSEIAGIMAGLFALALYAFDPNILGHNHYVTTDIGIAAFITFSFYYFLRFIKNPSWKNVAIGGLFLGLVHIAKFSSILILPIFVLVLLVYPFIKNLPGRVAKKDIFKKRFQSFGEYVGKGAVAFLISLLVIWVAYAINTFGTSEETMSQAINFNAPLSDTNIKNLYTNKALHSFNSNFVTRPLAEYGIGVNYVFRRVAGGNGAYYFGEVSDNAFLSYFPTVFAMKETFPFLILIMLAMIHGATQIISKLIAINWKKKKFIKKYWPELRSYFQNTITRWTLFGFIVFYSYLSITGNLNIGFRHLFPILPFLYILVSVAFFELMLEHKKKLHKYFKVSLLIIAFCLITETVSAFPYYLSYFNSSAGGPMKGYNYVTDSNADWGQDLKRLDKWIDVYNDCVDKRLGSKKCKKILAQPISTPCSTKTLHSVPLSKTTPLVKIDKIRVDYFGGGNPKYYLGDKYVQWWDSKRPIEEGWYAISTNFMQGSIYDSRLKPDGTRRKIDEESYRWLINYVPVYQVGTSIMVYYIPSEEME